MHMRHLLLVIAVAVPTLIFGCGGENDAATTAGPATEPAQADTAAKAAEPTQVAQAATEAETTDRRVLRKGGQAPIIRTVDIRGLEVDLEKIIAQEPGLIIEFFFNVDSGREIAEKLRTLDKRDSIQVVAFGLKEEEKALRDFASELKIDYFIVDTNSMADAPWLQEITSLPVTVFVHPNEGRAIVKVLRGAGKGKADIVKEIAQNFFQQRKLDEAQALAAEARAAGEDETEVRRLSGFIFAAQGKLDEAEAEFGAIDSKEGLAKVALDRGDYDKALDLAGQAGANNGYADTVKATALQRQGKLEEAARTFEAAAAKPAEEWQTSEALNGQGRILHEMGNTEEAIAKYRQAVDLSPYNIVALSNEGAAQRDSGNLEAAAAALEKAGQWGGAGDELVGLMLKQVTQALENANNLEKQEFIRQQIKDLSERYEELKAEGRAEPEDPWSTRPQILAFLPSASAQSAFFERAGTDVVIRREIESRLGSDPRVRVVEREMLDQLLQELDLGSSELADKDTQLQLGKVLSARMLGFLDFATLGRDNVMYVRLADTQTTELTNLAPKNLRDAADIGSLVQEVVDEILARVVDERQLQGLIADASSDDAIMINLGKTHGVTLGHVFRVIEEGEPIEVGGRVIAHKMLSVAKIEVTQLEDEYAVCKVVSKKDGVELAPEMRIKEVKKSAS